MLPEMFAGCLCVVIQGCSRRGTAIWLRRAGTHDDAWSAPIKLHKTPACEGVCGTLTSPGVQETCDWGKLTAVLQELKR